MWTYLAKTPSTNIGCDEWRKEHCVEWLEKLASRIALHFLCSPNRQVGEPVFVDPPLAKYDQMRPHEGLGNLSPQQYTQQLALEKIPSITLI
jgi:hypothetical protein